MKPELFTSSYITNSHVIKENISFRNFAKHKLSIYKDRKMTFERRCVQYCAWFLGPWLIQTSPASCMYAGCINSLRNICWWFIVLVLCFYENSFTLKVRFIYVYFLSVVGVGLLYVLQTFILLAVPIPKEVSPLVWWNSIWAYFFFSIRFYCVYMFSLSFMISSRIDRCVSLFCITKWYFLVFIGCEILDSIAKVPYAYLPWNVWWYRCFLPMGLPN